MVKKKPIYTLDLETDPFKHGRYPRPFACGLYAEGRFVHTWGENNCILQMKDIVELLPPGIIYIHNGGRFDIFYLLDWIVPRRPLEDKSNILIINSRIVKAEMECESGIHEIRDSYAILPFALENYKKKDIDYNKMEADVRDLHRDEIIEYLEADCVYLHELCSAFVEMFGTKLTVGSTAMGELQKFHKFDILGAVEDDNIRSRFYYGGRVQCFQKGIVKGDYKVYDVNSMYPHVMKSFKHPIGKPGWISREVSKFTCFVVAEGKNYGAFPRREKAGLRFDCESGVFSVSIHEWNTALRHNLFEPSRIIECINFDSRDTFGSFVDHFYRSRQKAKADGDDTHALFYKYILNSAYGKFAQNPENYFEYCITSREVMPNGADTSRFDDSSYRGWLPDAIPDDRYVIWKRPTQDYNRFNVATAASITGAARSVLLEAIANADSPLYCDTDSIIARSVKGISEDATQLGAWKIEANADRCCIAGKKLYAIFDGEKCVKQANKGVNVTAQEIVRICEGEIVTCDRDAPSFKLGVVPRDAGDLEGWEANHNFISRRVRMR